MASRWTCGHAARDGSRCTVLVRCAPWCTEVVRSGRIWNRGTLVPATTCACRCTKRSPRAETRRRREKRRERSPLRVSASLRKVRSLGGSGDGSLQRGIIPNQRKEYRHDPADGVILREAHPRSGRDARQRVRRPKNLPDRRTVLSATTGFGARSPARFRKRFFGRRTGCHAFPHARGGRLPQRVFKNVNEVNWSV